MRKGLLEFKVCTGPCGLEKPRSEFHFRNKAKGYVQAWCKECSKSPEAARRRKVSYELHREDKIAYQLEYQVANHGAYLVYQEQYRADHQDATREYRRVNSLYFAQKTRERRALQTNAFVESIDYLTVFERDGWICQLCLTAVDPEIAWPDLWSPELDHIVPLSRGGEHSYSNTQLAHKICNIKKGNR